MAINTITVQGDVIAQTRPPEQKNISGISLPGKYKDRPHRIIFSEDLMSKHTLLLGGTGCGKTNVFYYFLQQIKNRMSKEDVMLVFDTKGDFYSKFYHQGDVVISNSKQHVQNSLKWNIYKEVLVDGWDDKDIFNNVYEITHSLFKDAIERTSQQFFPSAARDLFSAILIAQVRLGKDDMEFRKRFFNNNALREYLDSLSVERLKKLLNPKVFPDLSSALMYLGDGQNDQALGVLAELQNVSRQIFIGEFAEDGRFSVRNFVREKNGKTLFIEYDLAMGETLTPIYRLLFDLGLKEAMGRNKSNGNVYMICDEFKLLPNLQHIEDGANFGRSLGVKIVAGLQSIEQLYEIYGESKGKNIAAGFSSVISFKSNDNSTREYVSDLYGKNIVLEQYKSSNNTIVEDKREGRTVEDWELNSLRIGEAIVGLAFEKPFRFQFDLYRG